MSASLVFQSRAFRDLEHRLARRRLQQLDPRMRWELALLAILIAGFLFWQVRVPLDGLVRARGPLTAAGAVLALWLLLAILAGAMAALRHARRLRQGPPGPEWLALPLAPHALERHLASESRARTLWLAVPAAGVMVASFGLLPIAWLPVLALVFAGLLLVAGRAGTTLGLAVAARGVPPGAGLKAIERVLVAATPTSRRVRFRSPRWRRVPAWLALMGKDLLVTARRGTIRRAAFVPLLLWIASVLVWRLPGEPAMRHFLAFALVLLAAAALAEWLVTLSGSDPFSGLRVLPLGVATVWGARFAWGVLGTLLLVAGQLAGARELSPGAQRVFFTWIGAASLGIAALGVNYGVTLFPRADVAERLLGLSLGLAVAASVMIPLSGWIVLLTAVLHSARRLPRWARLEEA